MYEKLTIVMPAYNAGAYIEQALASLQPAMGAQILIIDDGSTDDTVSKINRVVDQTDLQITVLTGQHRGASAARNLGMAAVKTEFVMFFDADDVLDFNECAGLPALMDNEVVDVISIGAMHQTTAVCMNSDRRLNLLIGLLGIEEDLLEYGAMTERFSCAGPVSKLYRMCFLREHNIRFPENIANGEDVLFNVAVVKYAHHIGYYHASLYRYRYNDESVSKKISYPVVANHIAFTDGLQKLAHDIVTDMTVLNGLLVSCYVNDYVTCLMAGVGGYERKKIRQHAQYLRRINWQFVTRKKQIMLHLINWRMDALVKALTQVKRFKLRQPAANEFLHY